MLINGRTGSHAIYQPRRPAKKQPARAASLLDHQLNGDPNGSLEQKCAWMRARQRSKAARGAA